MIRHFVPAVLSLLVLGAHFLRMMNLPILVLLLICVGLLTVRAPWAAYIVQTVLGLGVLVWILTLVGIALDRTSSGEPWIRMALIMGSVTLYTAYAAWHFRHPKIRNWFGTGRLADAGASAPDVPAV